jgi:hypothetical protein
VSSVQRPAPTAHCPPTTGPRRCVRRPLHRCTTAPQAAPLHPAADDISTLPALSWPDCSEPECSVPRTSRSLRWTAKLERRAAALSRFFTLPHNIVRYAGWCAVYYGPRTACCSCVVVGIYHKPYTIRHTPHIVHHTQYRVHVPATNTSPPFPIIPSSHLPSSLSTVPMVPMSPTMFSKGPLREQASPRMPKCFIATVDRVPRSCQKTRTSKANQKLSLIYQARPGMVSFLCCRQDDCPVPYRTYLTHQRIPSVTSPCRAFIPGSRQVPVSGVCRAPMPLSSPPQTCASEDGCLRSHSA